MDFVTCLPQKTRQTDRILVAGNRLTKMAKFNPHLFTSKVGDISKILIA